MRDHYIAPESRFAGRYSGRLFATLRLAYGRQWGALFAWLFLGLLGRGLLLSNANLIGKWVDSLASRGTMDSLDATHWLVWLTAVTVLGFACTILYRIGLSRISARAMSRLYDEITLRTSRFPISFFDTQPAGRIVTRFSTDYGNVFRIFGGPLAEFLSLLFDLICMVALMAIASPYSLAVCVVILALHAVVYRLNQPRLRRARRELAAARSPSIAHFAETTQGASTIRAYSREPIFTRRFAQLNARYLERRWRTMTIAFGFSYQMNALSGLTLFGTGLAGLALVRAGRLTIGSLGVAFTFVTLAGSSLQMFFEWMAQFEEALTSLERLDEYMHHPLEPGLRLPAASEIETGHPRESGSVSAPTAARGAAALEVRDLWLRYGDEAAPPVLRGISFRLAPRERLGVIGRTGSGKSSLIQAIFGFYPRAGGEIRFDGRAIEEYDRVEYRRHIGLIAQDPVILRGTLRDNLAASHGPGDAEMLEVLARVGLGAWAADGPRALDRALDERGANLSLGERQLICLARCLLQQASLIIMDEATSAVDPQSETTMVRATEEFFADRTQIIVAHRLSTLEHCDRILWLEAGRVRAEGPPGEVLPAFQRER